MNKHKLPVCVPIPMVHRSILNQVKRWSQIRPASVLALCLMLASCMTGPDYKRPEVPSPAQYKSAVPQEKASPNLAREWWRLFNDPDLTKLEEEAIKANLDLQAAMARVAQARASAASVKSEFYPVVTMNPSATRSRKPGSSVSESVSPTEKLSQLSSALTQVSNLLGQTSSTGQTSTTNGATSTGSSGTGSTSSSTSSSAPTFSNAFQVPFDLSYEIDMWGRVRRSYESEQAKIKASEYDFEVVRQTLLADVAQNYFNIRSLDAQDEILTKNLALYQEQVKLTEQKCKAGVSNETDYLQAKVQYESARADAADIRRQRADAEHAIAILLGRAPAEFTLGVRSLDGLPPQIPAGMPADILKQRPDVAEAEQNLASACAEIGVAKAEFFPTIKLTGSTGFESTEFKDVLDWKNRVWSIGPSISLPLFEGGKLKANLKKAKAYYEELEATYRNTVLAAYGDVEDALTDLHLRADQGEAQDKALDAAREYHRLTKIQYDTGVLDYLKLVDAEQTLLNNELAAVKILKERMVSTVLLVKAIGSGWDAEMPVGNIERN